METSSTQVCLPKEKKLMLTRYSRSYSQVKLFTYQNQILQNYITYKLEFIQTPSLHWSSSRIVIIGARTATPKMQQRIVLGQPVTPHDNKTQFLLAFTRYSTFILKFKKDY
uniref:Uncharacterized protein n=1 Tax=Strigamia maritima TaxID=126957 RepID=T1J4I0_STRMM